MVNYEQSGETITVELDSGETVASGELVQIETNLFGVAQSDADGDADESVACLRKGIFSLRIAAPGGSGLSAGAPMYFDGGPTSDVSSDAIGPKVGYLIEDVGAAETSASVLLVPEASGMFVEGVAELDASSGLAIGDTEFGPELPAGAVVIEAMLNVQTTFTSATDAATIALGLDTDAEGELEAAIAISDGTNPFDAGLRHSDADGDAANATTPLTAPRRFLATVAVEALTDGMLQVIYRYFVPAS
jgi:predicted RecA/RadA family phage recombinase